MIWWQQLIAVIFSGLLGGGTIQAVLLHLRERDVSEEDAADKETSRYQREINRLDAKVEKQAERIDKLDEQLRIERIAHAACDRRNAVLDAELMKMKAILQGRGEGLQHVQEALSAVHVEERKKETGDDQDN